MGYSERQQCFKLRRLSDNKQLFAAHCIFNEDEFPYKTKKLFIQNGDASVIKKGDFLLPPSKVRKPAQKNVVVTKGRTQDLMTILKAHSTFDDLEEEHAIALALMVDAQEVVNALTLISKIGGSPRSVKMALKGPDGDAWLASLQEELLSHTKFDTLGPALKEDEIPVGVLPVPLDAALKTKRDGRRKARLIVKGFHLIDGLDYNETYSGVPDITVLKLMLAIATVHDWEFESSDAVTAYLQCNVDVPVLVQVPDWYTNTQKDYDCSKFTYHFLKKAVPGIPQAPRLFGKKVEGILRKVGLTSCQHCPALYTCKERSLILVHHVDDFLFVIPKDL